MNYCGNPNSWAWQFRVSRRLLQQPACAIDKQVTASRCSSLYKEKLGSDPWFVYKEKLGSDPWFVALAPGFPGFAYISKNRDLTPVFCFSGKMP
jgi:hypothetical protein